LHKKSSGVHYKNFLLLNWFIFRGDYPCEFCNEHYYFYEADIEQIFLTDPRIMH
jgi:hypothetical protein